MLGLQARLKSHMESVDTQAENRVAAPMQPESLGPKFTQAAINNFFEARPLTTGGDKTDKKRKIEEVINLTESPIRPHKRARQIKDTDVNDLIPNLFPAKKSAALQSVKSQQERIGSAKKSVPAGLLGARPVLDLLDKTFLLVRLFLFSNSGLRF
jgi:hypothetical protein